MSSDNGAKRPRPLTVSFQSDESYALEIPDAQVLNQKCRPPVGSVSKQLTTIFEATAAALNHKTTSVTDCTTKSDISRLSRALAASALGLLQWPQQLRRLRP